MRALLFFVLAIAVFLIIRILFKKVETLKNRPTSENISTEEQRMVSCEFCGVHLPESEALGVEVTPEGQAPTKKYFCCKEHLQSFIDQHS